MIDLQEIIDGELTFYADSQSTEEIKDCIKEAIRRTLEVASKEAVVKYHQDSASVTVDKDSILNVMEKVK